MSPLPPPPAPDLNEEPDYDRLANQYPAALAKLLELVPDVRDRPLAVVWGSSILWDHNRHDMTDSLIKIARRRFHLQFHIECERIDVHLLYTDPVDGIGLFAMVGY